jgi:hypothetical protein
MWSLLLLAWIPLAAVFIPAVIFLLPVLAVVLRQLVPMALYLGLAQLLVIFYPQVGGYEAENTLPPSDVRHRSNVNINSHGSSSSVNENPRNGVD